MPTDLNKNITITATAQTGQLEQSITNLNKIIDSLLAQQKQLDAAGQQNSSTFDNVSAKLEIFQKRLQDVTSQVNANIAALNSLNTTAKTSEAAINSLTAGHQKAAKATGDSTARAKELGTQLNSLNQTLKQQTSNVADAAKSISSQSANMQQSSSAAQQLQSEVTNISAAFQQQATQVDQSKTAFDAHQQVMDHLKTSFDEIKDVSGEFGPSLQDAAKGFNMMKSGLAVMKDGLTGVGDALKADGFDFLLQVLQMMFDYFVKTSTGTKMLQGAISAIGVVVNKVEGFFRSFMDAIIQAFSHPVDSIKKLGQMVEQNIINRFTAFSKILDGLIHLDFKKVTDGAIQAATGVTNATGKMSAMFNATVKGVKETAGEMADAYQQGTQLAAGSENTIKTHANNVVTYTREQIAQIKQMAEASKNAINAAKGNTPDASSSSSSPLFPTNHRDADDMDTSDIDAPQKAVDSKIADEKLAEGKKFIQSLSDAYKQKKAEDQKQEDIENKTRSEQVKSFALNEAKSISDGAFSIIQNGIKQQADAKIAALENQKNAELANTSLTASQRSAIEAKYKKQEDQVKLKAFKQEQEASIAQAIINGALAITKGTAQTGVLASLYIPSIIAETAIEVAKIESQKPPAYASGGLHYTSDGRGGVLPGYSRTDNTNAFLRSGEGVVVSEAMRAPWARNLVSAINVGFGGRDFATAHAGRGFAVGGIFTDGGDANRYYNAPVNDQKNLANTIAYQMINNFPPVYVDVKDINNQQNILAQTINRVNL